MAVGTQQELINRVREDPLLSSTTVISDANLKILLQEGADDMADKSGAIVLAATWNTVASTLRYVLAGGSSPKVTGFLRPYWFGGEVGSGALIYTDADGNIKNAPVDFQWTSEQMLDLEFPGWSGESASDTLKKVALGYDTSGYLNLVVYPKSSTTTPSFKLFFVSKGVDMSATDRHPWINETTPLHHLAPYEKGCAFYAMSQLHLLKTKLKDEATKYEKMYLETVLGMQAAGDQINRAMIQGHVAEAQVVADQSFGSA